MAYFLTLDDLKLAPKNEDSDALNLPEHFNEARDSVSLVNVDNSYHIQHCSVMSSKNTRQNRVLIVSGKPAKN